MQIRRKPEIYFTFASYLIPPQINKSGVHLLQICSLWKNNVCFLQKSKQTCCKSICMHHCFPTFTQTPNPKPQTPLPPVPLDLISPQEGFSPGPLTPRFKHFPTTRIFAHYLLCVFCVVPGIEPLCKNTANWKRLLTHLLKNNNYSVHVVLLLPWPKS